MSTFSNENEYCEDLLPAFFHNRGMAMQFSHENGFFCVNCGFVII